MRFVRPLYNRLRSNKDFRFVLAVSIFAFFFKLYLLNKKSLYIDPDEGYYLVLARNLLEGKGYGFNGLPNIIFPPFLPLAIALFYLIFHNLQLALNIITALSGTLLGVISYLIARKKLPSFPSFASFLLVLFIFQLNSFWPMAGRYTQVLYRGSDILNAFLVFACLYSILLLVEKNKYWLSVSAGILFSLTYLTRPEGFLLFLGLFMFLLALRLFSFITVSFKRLSCLALVFLIFSLPYILYLKKTAGTWTVSGKIPASQNYRESLLEVIKNENWAPFRQNHYALNKESKEMNDLYFGYHDQSDQGAGIFLDVFLRRAGANLKLYAIIPKTLFPLPLVPFFCLGLFAAVSKIINKKSRPDLVILILLPYSIAIEALSYPIPRHHLFLLPLLILYSMEGLFFFVSKISALNEVRKKNIFLFAFSLLFVYNVYEYVIYSTKNLLNYPSFKSSRLADARVSELLKKRGARVIMSTYPHFAVKAFSDWQVMPMASLPSIIQFGRRKNVDFVVLPEEKSVFYHILNLKESHIPRSQSDPFAFAVIEKDDFYELIKAIPTKRNELSYPDKKSE